MRTITYVSTAKKLFTEDELLTLLEKSRDNNEKFGITGMLLYASGNFIQTIEGPEESIRQLYNNIRNDVSHQNVLTVIDEPLEERNFSGWHMGFAKLSKRDFNKIRGFYGIFSMPANENNIPAKESVAKSLLASFRKHIR